MAVSPALLAQQLSDRKAAGEKLAVLTAYDYPTARLLDEAGVDLILVGDSLGMVVLGMPDTTGVTMQMMLHHAAAVRRGVQRATIIVDLPSGSYGMPDMAVHNARRLVEAGADAVKLEGGVDVADQVRAITQAGIAYIGHIGMLPQSVKHEGGYKKKGKTDDDANRLLADARALEEAGAAGIVLESMVPEVAERISKAIQIPTIGIGAGPNCDGQVLVTPDLLGAFPWFKPPFATALANEAMETTRAAREWIAGVKGA
ncbi:3-methyl-2-oxobutanoate hydroxymethyltransferase [Verrucomicrobium spinosum]|uniref:3-methyl-2-oxobutanoate hydroxymethyltransferase n=1 Tax=Verrucomicrobium spinosum TaxID=2736 RepID=UPI0001745874|nr:3-methyl-2-oxobutanoate hydroxymethyltransferase [Verrucomicrobium spinosum]